MDSALCPSREDRPWCREPGQLLSGPGHEIARRVAEETPRRRASEVPAQPDGGPSLGLAAPTFAFVVWRVKPTSDWVGNGSEATPRLLNRQAGIIHRTTFIEPRSSQRSRRKRMNRWVVGFTSVESSASRAGMSDWATASGAAGPPAPAKPGRPELNHGTLGRTRKRGCQSLGSLP
jgi:hypothetical protein